MELLAVLEFSLVEVDDVVVADAQTRGIELELGFLLAGDADADLAFLGERILEQLQLLLVVEHRNGVHEAVVDQLGDVLHILRPLETVADDVAVLVDDSAVVERVDDMNVVCRRRFEMNVVLHCLLQHE